VAASLLASGRTRRGVRGMSGGSEPRRVSENRVPRLAASQAGVRASSDSAAENLSIAGWDDRIFRGPQGRVITRDVDSEGGQRNVLPGIRQSISASRLGVNPIHGDPEETAVSQFIYPTRTSPSAGSNAAWRFAGSLLSWPYDARWPPAPSPRVPFPSPPDSKGVLAIPVAPC
jgi:hypothetical protein